MLRRLGILGLGVVAFALYHVFIAYMVLFLVDASGWSVIPQGIDHPPAGGPVWRAAIIDVGLISLFGLHHSVAARPWFKEWITRYIPESAERSFYVLSATLLFFLLVLQWRPIDLVIWNVEATVPRVALWALFGASIAVLGASESAVDRNYLIGIKQAWAGWKGEAPPEPPAFQTPGLYQYVRHPMMTGLLIALWATPRMTVGHVLFAASMTAYILIGIQFEERALIDAFGETYRRYREQTPALFPVPMDLSR